MSVLIYWFRNDLRLADNLSLMHACSAADALLPIYIHPTADWQSNVMDFERVGSHRKQFIDESVAELKGQLRGLGSDLFEYIGRPEAVLPEIMKAIGALAIYCEQIEAPEEVNQVTALKRMGIEVHQYWQSSMLDPHDLTFELESMPDVFTAFRREVEKHHLQFAAPIKAPLLMPPLPSLPPLPSPPSLNSLPVTSVLDVHNSDRGGEQAAITHLDGYLKRRLPDSYKQTRNQLMGQYFSSQFSCWLASGCISARLIAAELAAYEKQYGANEGTYWLWFELLWRDYFRFIHFKYGKQLYRPQGLAKLAPLPLDAMKFEQWKTGSTGEPLIDAGMHELERSGYLSNRMRQIVASYWIYDMDGDWRAGAAWFESQLIDYDVYSNQGNWLYIAGLGTDPRGGRRFNVVKQTQDHDPDGVYRKKWL